MNARQLEVFRTVMRQGTLTAAAEALHVSQPAISKLLAHFESQLGYRLFDRIGGRLLPTAEARLLYADADRIFREIEALRALSERIRRNEIGLLRLGASAPATFSLVPGAADRFRRRNPGTRLVLQTLSAEEIDARLLAGEIDLGLSMSPMASPSLRSIALGRAEIVALLPPGDPLGEAEALTPADLAGRPLIGFSTPTLAGSRVAAAFAEAGLVYAPAIEVTLSIAAAPLVARGLGPALVDGLVDWPALAAVVTRPFRPSIPLEIFLSTNLALPQSRFLREFSRDVQAEIRTRA